MKRIGIKYCFFIGITFVIFVFSDVRIFAATYYVSNSGSDSNSGLTAEMAWKTLDKVNRTFLKPGDKVLFRSGDTWAGTIKVNSSGKKGYPITYDAYGSGAKPVISGWTTITGWVDEGGGIYSKVITSDAQTNMVTIDGVNTGMGRTPNAGAVLSYESFTTSTSITDNQLTASPDWDGAEVVIRKNPWRWDRGLITDHTGTAIAYTDLGTGNSATANYGYFIQNDLRTLDQFGEWYHNSATGKFSMFFGAVNPTTRTVKVATKTHLINNIGTSNNAYDYITIKNLQLEGAINCGVNIGARGTYHIIENCDISYCGENGVKGSYFSSYNTVTRNTFNNCTSAAIAFQAGSDARDNIITYNSVRNTGLIIGSAKGTYNGFYSGIAGGSENGKIEYNTVTNSGYNGIIAMFGHNTTIQYNVIDSSCIVLDDGAAIYTAGPTSRNTLINGNIVSNTIGNSVGSLAPPTLVGIYLDEFANDVKVTNNTVYNNKLGIFLHKALNCTIRNNTLFNNNTGIRLNNNTTASSMTGNVIRKNKVATNTDNVEHFAFSLRSLLNDNYSFGVADSNYYARPLNDTRTISSELPATGVVWRTLAEWQTLINQEVNTKFIGFKLSKGETAKLFYNKSNQSITFYLGKSVFQDIPGNNLTDTFSLKPFTSRILIGKDFDLINQKPEISDQSFNISSPKLPNDSIGQIFAFDPDEDQILKFLIVGGNELKLFSVDSLTGRVFSVNEINTSRNLIIDITLRVTDNSPNPLSDSAKIIIKIEGMDLSPPVITSFSIPSRAFSFTIPIETLQATDDLGIKGYLISEYSVFPDLKNPHWKPVAPLHFSFSHAGTFPLHVWVRDSAGNISSPAVDTIIITLPDLSPKHSEYLFEESSGISIFDSRDDNHGIIVNDVLRGEGLLGSGISFTGSGYVDYGHCFGENVLNEVTLSVWLKPKLTNRSSQGIIIHGGPNTITYGLYITPDSLNIRFITKGTSNEELYINNINELWDGNWHHIAAIYNGSEKLIYLDGKLLTSAATTGQIEVGYGYNLLAGAGSTEINPSFLYHGSLDEVRIYNYALNESEIKNLFHSVNRIAKKIFVTEHVPVCEGENYLGWNGVGEYTRILQRLDPSSSGADSIVTTYLELQPVSEEYEFVTIKEGENYLGWTESGKYQQDLIAANGCDSIIITNLTVIPAIYTIEDVFICEGESYMEHTSQGQYHRKYISFSGADSIIITNLFIYPRHYAIREIKISEGEDYKGWTETGKYMLKLNSVFMCDSIEVIHLEVIQPEIQFVDLEKGWNLFSTYLIPSQLNMENVFENLNQQVNLVEVQDENGNIYIQDDDKLINFIGDLRESKGYNIRVNYPCVLKITGQPIKLPLDIHLHKGWNIISFPFNGSADAMGIINPLITGGILEKVQDEKGNSIEHWGSYVGWVNGIGNFNAGEGYLVQVKKDVILSISGGYDKSGMKFSGTLKPVYFKPVYYGNGFSHMNINLTGLDMLNLKVGDEIAAFDGNKCVGAVKLNDFNIANNFISINSSASYENFLDGFNAGNNIELRIWQSDLNTEFVLQTEIINGTMKYENRSSVFAQLSGKIKFDPKIDFSIYPNPAYDKVMIYFSHEPETDAKIIIADINGKPVLSKVVKSKFESLDVNYLSSGTYLVKIISGDMFEIKKMVINKMVIAQ